MTIKKYKQLYAHKLDNLDKMDQLLERFYLPKPTHKNIDNLNKPLSVKQIQSIINNCPKQKTPGLDGFTAKVYQTFKK